MQVETLELQSEKNRKRLVEIVYKAKAGHIGGDLSCLNVLTALYFDIMRVWPDKPKETKRRSEERRVGKECASMCRSRWSPYH